MRGHVVDERRAGSPGDAEDMRLGGSRGWDPEREPVDRLDRKAGLLDQASGVAAEVSTGLCGRAPAGYPAI